jgi:DNA-binding NarL/FixJ family response regulator
MPVMIGIADDHQIVRQGLRALLEAEPDFHIVGEAGDGLAAITLAEQNRPDVLLLDLMLPGPNGLEVTRQICHRIPQTRVVILSMHSSDSYVAEALQNGARGYVLKQAESGILIRAIREVMWGRCFLSPPLSEQSIAEYLRNVSDTGLDPYETLTTREREVLYFAAESLTSAEIGSRLFISPRTVETHKARLMQKLGLTSQTEVILYAIRKGIVSIEQ